MSATPSTAGWCLRLGLVGFGFGFVLSWIGFSDFGEVHRMFTFADLRLTLVFAGAVMLTAGMFAAINRRAFNEPRLSLHRGVIPGGVLFGAGWALTGACPSIALVQLGEGRLPALATIAGILLGGWLYGMINRRYLHLDHDGCS